jgi:hypothetical protein
MLRGKNMKNQIYIGLVLVVLVVLPFSSAVGVARPFFSDNTYDMDVNDTNTIGFQLQNGENASKTMVLRISAQNPFEIEGGNFYEKQFTLASGEVKDVPIEFYSEREGLYRIDYGYSEICSGGGTICFNTEITDSFFVQVGDDNTYYGFDIPLVYAKYRLSTDSRTITDIEDLIISSNWSTIDFSDTTVDLTGFTENRIDVGQGYISISDFQGLNHPARIMFSGIDSNYKIYKDGSICSISTCTDVYYTSGSKKLYFNVPGFSRYEVQYDSTTPAQTGGSTGGSTLTPQNTSNSTQTPPGSSLNTGPVVNQTQQPVVPVQPTQPVVEPADITKLTEAPNPFLTKNNSEQTIPVSTEGKPELIKAIMYGFVALIFAGILLYYVGKNSSP